MNFQHNKKLMYRLEKNIISKQNTEEINRQKSNKKINPTKEVKTKQREEGFSVYLMGANEERIKNLRKKEQIDKVMKNRSNNNSKSIQNRVKGDNKLSEKSDAAFDIRSKSRHREINSALVYRKVHQNDNKFIEVPQNYKINNSRDSLNNIEDMLSNINMMNKNIASNLNKLTVDSPANKRRRNDYKYGGVDFSSTGREKSQNNSRLLTKHINNDLQRNDTEDKENESKTININLKDFKYKASLKNTLEDSSGHVKLHNNNKTEGIDLENMINEYSSNNDLNKSLNRQVLNYKLSINERPISSVMNISNYKTTHENINSPSNLDISKPARPFSQIHLRARERLTNRKDTLKGDSQVGTLVLNNSSFTKKKVQTKIKNLNNISITSNLVSPKINSNLNSKNYNFNKKNEIISRINQLDDKKISKLARLIERLDQFEVEESHEINNELIHKQNKTEQSLNRKLNPINKFNINNNADNTSTGNFNLNKNDISIDTDNSLKFSLNKFKIDLNSSVSNNKIIEKLQSKRDYNNIIEDNNSSYNIKLRESSKSIQLTNNQYNSPRTFQNYKVITLFLMTNYGHSEKIGLTEVQIFDRTNRKINIIDCKLDNTEGNEIGIIKIFNNKFHTIDENEMWVTSFSKEKIKINIFYEAIYEVEYMTFWNYNGKDLIKGVKDVEIHSGSTCIFKGKISKGVFNIKNNYSTTISLNSYNFNNDKYNFEIGGIIELKEEIKSEKKKSISNIKLEIDTSHLNNIPSAQKTLENKKVEMIYEIEESLCSSQRDKKRDSNKSEEILIHQGNLNQPILYNNISRSQASLTMDEFSNMKSKSNHYITCQTIKIYLTSNWGDPNYVGLTGIEFLDEKCNVISNNEICSYNAYPRDMNTAFGDCGDIRVLENLFNEETKVNDLAYMWLTTFNKEDPPYLEISFENSRQISGLRIWNYNKKFELDRGVRSMEIQFDDHLFYEHCIYVRMGIGENDLNYSQDIVFPVEDLNYNEAELAPFKDIRPASLRIKQDYETPYLPIGFVFKLTLLSNWGDPCYIGMNNIEFYDQTGIPLIKLHNPRIISCPEGIKSFSVIETDLKSPKNSNKEVKFLSEYINTKNVDQNDQEPNVIYFLFEKPVAISFIQFWNYDKNPSSGVKELLIQCDENIIYKGSLKKIEPLQEEESTCVFFTSDSNITHSFEEKIYSESFKPKQYNTFQSDKETIYFSLRNEDLNESEKYTNISNEK